MNKNAKRFAMLNYKGGTGKTCTLVNLAFSLSAKGYKVLIIDTDPQGSTSYHLNIKSKYTLYDIIVKSKSIDECITNARKNLDLIQSNERLFPAEIYMYNQKNREHILSDRLSTINHKYDYIFIDCSPTINLMNQNTLLYANHILIPVSMEYMSLAGTKQLIKNIQLLNKVFNTSIKISKIIPTFYNLENEKSKNVLNSLQRAFKVYLSSPIRSNPSISEAAGHGQSIYEFEPKGYAVEDFDKLTEEVINYV